MKKGYTIAIYNRKGGAGKTTCTASVGALLAQAGYKVLLVDLDSQGNLTSHFLGNTPEEGASLITDGEIYIKPVNLLLDIAPATLQLAAADYEIASREDRYDIIKDVLARQAKDYDYVIEDVAPAMNHLSIAAIAASDYVLCPVLPDVDSLAGLKLVEKVCDYAGKDGGIDGVFFANFSCRRYVDREVEAALRQEYGEKVFDTVIRQCSKFRESRLYNMDIASFAPNSNGAKDYMALSKELLTRIQGNI